MPYIRCGNNKVPIEACKTHSAGFRRDGIPINRDPKIDVYAHCIDCIEWIELDKDYTVENIIVKTKKKDVPKRNTARRKKRKVVNGDLEDVYLEKCEDIGELTVWLTGLNMPSLLRLAKSVGIKAFGIKKNIVIGEIIALEGGKV